MIYTTWVFGSRLTLLNLYVLRNHNSNYKLINSNKQQASFHLGLQGVWYRWDKETLPNPGRVKVFPHPFIQLVTTTGNTQRIICFMFSLVHTKEAQLLVNCIQEKKQVWTLSITKGVWSCRRGDFDFCSSTRVWHREGSHSPTDQTQAPALLCLPEHNLHLLGEPQGFTGKEEPSKKGRGCE